MTIKEYAEQIFEKVGYEAIAVPDDVIPFLIKLVNEEKEACRRIAVRKMIAWTEQEDKESDDYRCGVEEGASKIAVKIHESKLEEK